jgi:hypothetical protein
MSFTECRTKCQWNGPYVFILLYSFRELGKSEKYPSWDKFTKSMTMQKYLYSSLGHFSLTIAQLILQVILIVLCNFFQMTCWLSKTSSFSQPTLQFCNSMCKIGIGIAQSALKFLFDYWPIPEIIQQRF